MLTASERRLRDDRRAVIDVLVATRAVFANLMLPGKFGPAGIELAFAIGNRHAERDAGWTRVCHTALAHDAGIRRDQLRLLVRAMAGDSLIERREVRPVATSQGYRSAIYLRSAVGGEVLDLLRALACWSPDWSQYVRRQAPRPRRARICPHCGGVGVQIVTSCLACGVVLSERTELAGGLVHGDGEPPG